MTANRPRSITFHLHRGGRPHMSQYVIARRLGLAQGTVSKYLWRARQAGLSWPLPAELDDDARLEARLFPPPPDLPPDKRPKPDPTDLAGYSVFASRSKHDAQSALNST